MKFLRHLIFLKAHNLSDAKNKCREHDNQERISLLPLSVLKSSLQVQKKVNIGVNFEDVKPIHATGLLEMCNFLKSFYNSRTFCITLPRE